MAAMSKRLRTSILAAVMAISASTNRVAEAENASASTSTSASTSASTTAPASASSAAASGASKAPVENKIEAGIWKLGVLSADSKLSVETAEKQAVVTVYGGGYEKAADGLVKIDAVLIAKCVFDNAADLVRAKVCFGALKQGVLRQVSVSKGDIKAFGSNQLSKSDLLASLEIVQFKRTGTPATFRAAPLQKAAQSRDAVETLDATGIPTGKWVSYRNSKTGLTLSYPSHWKLQEAPEKDTLFRIDAPNCTLGFAVDNTSGMPVRQSASMWENLVLSQLKDYKLISSQRLRLGQNKSLQGYSIVIQFSAGDTTIRQRWIFFGQTGSVYHAILSMPQGANRADIPDAFRIISSITFTGGASSAQIPVEAPAVQPWSRLSLFQEGPITINYPAEWLVKQHPEPDVVVKFVGRTKDGDAEMQIRRSISDHNLSLDEIATLVETHYLKQLKNYRRLRQEQHSLPGGASGILQEFTFDLNGVPFKHMSAYRRSGDHLYTLNLVSSGWKQGDMLTLFNRCLGTWTIRE